MSRWVLAMLLASAAPLFSDDLKTERPQSKTITKEEVPKEEDESLVSKQYSFNPLQAEKEVRVGNFYFRSGKYRAAMLRFREATKWNQNYGEAWLRMGEAAEKDKDWSTAKEAFSKYLALAPEAKDAPEVKKKLEKLK